MLGCFLCLIFSEALRPKPEGPKILRGSRSKPHPVQRSWGVSTTPFEDRSAVEGFLFVQPPPTPKGVSATICYGDRGDSPFWGRLILRAERVAELEAAATGLRALIVGGLQGLRGERALALRGGVFRVWVRFLNFRPVGNPRG